MDSFLQIVYLWLSSQGTCVINKKEPSRISMMNPVSFECCTAVIVSEIS